MNAELAIEILLGVQEKLTSGFDEDKQLRGELNDVINWLKEEYFMANSNAASKEIKETRCHD